LRTNGAEIWRRAISQQQLHILDRRIATAGLAMPITEFSPPDLGAIRQRMRLQLSRAAMSLELIGVRKRCPGGS